MQPISIYEKTDILGVKIDCITKRQLLEQLRGILAAPFQKTHMIATTYSEFIVAAQKDKGFREVLNGVDFNVADGIGILWAASFLNPKSEIRNPKQIQKNNLINSKLSNFVLRASNLLFLFIKTAYWTAFKQEKIKNIIPERISGADLIWDVCRLASKTGQSVYFLGGYGDVVSPILKKYPNLKVAGRDESDPTEEGLIDKINKEKPDILLTAYGPVRQEKWIWKNKERLNVRLAIGLGGTFDYIVGKRKRPGKVWQKFGLEWLYRLITQPWRAKRMWNAIIVFTWMVVKESFKKRKPNQTEGWTYKG